MTTSDKGKATFSVNAAVSYKFSLGDQLRLGDTVVSVTTVNPSVEAHVSTATKNQQDSISAKIPLQTGILYVTPAYKTNKGQKTETYGIDVLFSSILSRPIQTGQMIPFGAIFKRAKAGYPGIRLIPYVGFESGYASFSTQPSVYNNHSGFSRFLARLKADIFLTPRLDVAVDYYHRTFLTGANDSFEFVDISPILYLDGNPEDPATQHFSLGMTFKYGKTTPQFQNVNSISDWLGIKF